MKVELWDALTLGTHLFQCKIAGSKRFLNLTGVALLCRLNGGSKTVQDTFESELFHIGPSDFPQLLVLFRFNGDEFYLLSTAPSQIFSFFFILSSRTLSLFFFRILFRSQSHGSLACRKNMLNKCQFSFDFRFSFIQLPRLLFLSSDTLQVFAFLNRHCLPILSYY